MIMPNKLSAQEAQAAVDAVADMQKASWRRAVPSRKYGISIALLIASLFALYALNDPYPYILVPILGLAVFIATSREKSGIYAQSQLTSKKNIAAFAVVIAFMLALFFGAILIRRTYDMAWVPIAAGILAGLIIFAGNESARRAFRTKANEKQSHE